MNDQLAGALRAFVPALVAYAVGKGWIAASMAADVTALGLTGGAVVWAVIKNRQAAKVAQVAAMPGTTVSSDGRTITVVDSNLAAAAKEAATNAAGK